MSMIFMEGFDHFDRDDLQAYVTAGFGGYISSTDRFDSPTGYSNLLIAPNERPQYALESNSTSEGVLGFAWMRAGLGEDISLLVCYYSITAYQAMEVGITSSNLLKVSQNGTVRCTANAAYSLQINTWYYVEVEYKFHASAGYINLYQDGILVASHSGVTTGYGGWANSFNYFQCRQGKSVGNMSCWFDDIYILDTTGDVNNSRLGEVNIVGIQPYAEGSTTEWSAYPAENYNYENVDELNQDGDTTYNYTITSGAIDTFPLDQITTFSGAVAAIKMRWYARKTDIGTRSLRPVVTYSGENRFGANNFPQAIGYTWQEEVLEYVPVLSGVATITWTTDIINNSEFGYEVSQ